MSDATLAFNILTKYRDTGADAAARDMDRLGKSGSRMGSTLKKAGAAGAFALAAGVALAGKALISATQSAIQDEAAQKRLALALRNNAHASDSQIASTEKWITAQGKAYGVADDDLRPALGRLVTATHDVGKAQKLASLAMDVSAGTGKSLKQVTEALMKAQNGQIGGLSRLGLKTQDTEKDTAALQAAQIGARKAQLAYTDAVREFGVGSDEAKTAALELEYRQTKLGEAQSKTKKTTIDFDEAVKRLGDQFGGQAAKNADTLEGKMARLKVQWDEGKEAVGAKLIPALSSLATIMLNRVLPAVGQTVTEMRNGEGAAGVLGNAIKLVGSTAATAAKFLNDHRSVILAVIAGYVAWKTATIALNTVAAIQLTMLKAQTVGTVQYSVASKAAAVATKVWAAGQWLLNAALTANPIGLVIVGLVALGTALYIAWRKSSTFREIVTGALEAVEKAASWVFEAIPKYAKAAFDFLKAKWPLLLAILAGPFGLAVYMIAKHWDKITAGASKTKDYVVDRFRILQEKVTGTFKAMGAGITRAWDYIKNGTRSAVLWLVDKVLWMAERVLDAAIGAFGWAPGIGDKLKDAREKVTQFREDVNKEMDSIRDEDVKITVKAGTVAGIFGLHGAPPASIAAHAEGGPVSGGTPGRDSVLAALMPGEHVFTAEEVKRGGGHQAMKAIRRMLKRGEFSKHGEVPAFARGGPVFGASTPNVSHLGDPVQKYAHAAAVKLTKKVIARINKILKSLGGEGSLSPVQIARGQAFARSQVGDPYVWGGVGPNGFDCSGFVGAVLNAAQGKNPYSRRGSTGTMPWAGFSPGKGSFSVGWFTGSPGHMAGSIGKMGIESAGGSGVRIGAAATPVSSFPHVAHYDQGGWLQPGWTAAYNGTGRPERVISGGGSSDDILGRVEVIVKTDDGREIQRKLLTVRRRTGRPLGFE